jgi:hypothetical protein
MKAFIVNLLKKKILVGRRRAISGIIKYQLRKWMFYTATGKSDLNIVKREEIVKNSEKYHVLQFGSEESIVLSQPYNSSDKLPSFIIKRVGTITLRKPFVFEVANAELIGPAAVGFDQDGSLISETVPTIKNLEKYLPTRTLISKKLPSFGTLQVDTACSLINWWHTNYYHWFMQSLIKLEGLEYYQEQTGKKPVLIIPSNLPRWKIESLRLLGYEADDCIQWNMSRIKVERLVVPSFRHGPNGIMSATGCRWLRQRIFSNLPDVESKQLSFSSRIYISRPKTVGRYLINEDEVLEALTPFGFVAYTLENLSLSDQVKLFSQAEIVVSAHGAGLTNMIFAQNLIVIELFGSFGIPTLFLLAKALGFQYGCLMSDHNGRNQYSEKFNGIMVDIDKFQAQYNGIMVDVARLRDLVAEMLHIYSDRKPANTAYPTESRLP